MITTGQIFWEDFAYATDKCSGITLNVHLVFLGEHLWFPVKKFTVLSIPGKLKTIWTMTIWLRFACSSLFFSLPVYWSVSETLRSEAAWRYAGGDSYLWLDRVPTSLGEPDYRPPTSGISRHLLSSTSSPAFQAFSSSLVSFWCWLFFAPYDLRRVHLFLQLDQWHKRAQCRYATEGTNYPPGFVFNPLHTMQCVQVFPCSWIICWNWTPQPAIILLVLPSLTFYGAAGCIFTPQLSDILSQTESEDRSIAEPVTDSLTEWTFDFETSDKSLVGYQRVSSEIWRHDLMDILTIFFQFWQLF